MTIYSRGWMHVSLPALLAALVSSSALAIPPVTPVFDPANFDQAVENPYFPLRPGTAFTYLSQKPDGTEAETVMVTHQHKMILGVSVFVVHDSVFLNEELSEETFDWYANDRFGNVWYMGEDSRTFEHGVVVSTEGSWEAGKHGAVPGFIMEANPAPGDKYRQEFQPGVAEDVGRVVALDQTVILPAFGSLIPHVFTHCVKTRDTSALDPGVVEFKYYAPGIGLILEVEHDDEGHITRNTLTHVIHQ